MSNKGTCKNCGGDYEIHHWETQQCPFGGVEAGPNRPDTWVSTRFEAEDGLQERIEKLETQVKALLDAVPSAKVQRG